MSPKSSNNRSRTHQGLLISRDRREWANGQTRSLPSREATFHHVHRGVAPIQSLPGGLIYGIVVGLTQKNDGNCKVGGEVLPSQLRLR